MFCFLLDSSSTATSFFLPLVIFSGGRKNKRNLLKRKKIILIFVTNFFWRKHQNHLKDAIRLLTNTNLSDKSASGKKEHQKTKKKTNPLVK